MKSAQANHCDLDMLVDSSNDSHETLDNVIHSVSTRVIDDPKVNAGHYRHL